MEQYFRNNRYCDITPEILALESVRKKHSRIDPELYTKYNVKRGLRDQKTNRGVLASLTQISQVVAYDVDAEGRTIPRDGQLFYRGMNVQELTAGFLAEDRLGFEEAAYLLIFGELPTYAQLKGFRDLLAGYRTLPSNFVRDVIMKASTADMMNTLARAVLTLYCYDDRANDLDLPNVLRQCLQLTANLPLLSIYSYQAYQQTQGNSLIIHPAQEHLSTAENILALLRPDKSYSKLEAKVLDLVMVLHLDHGSNNSTFTNHVVTSSGTDTYAAMAASLCSLKGPRHGGANAKVMEMIADLRETLSNPLDDGAVRDYLAGLLRKEGFDRLGLIYGLGHAVYTLSDPRAEILREYAGSLSAEKGRDEEMEVYRKVERIGKELLLEKTGKQVATNVDFYSGFVYDMLGLPRQLHTPIFAVARIPGWTAHRMEELGQGGKIIRPACKCVAEPMAYVPMAERCR